MPWATKSAALVGAAVVGFVFYIALSGPTVSSVAFGQIAEKLHAAQTLSFDIVVTFDADKEKVFKSRTYFMVPGKSRQEMRSADDEGFAVMDFPAGKALMVSTKWKTAMVSPIKGGAELDMARDEIDGLRSLQGKDSRSLGEKQIDGMRANGYEIKSELKTTVVWANAETGDPLRVEETWNNAPSGPATVVMTNFQLGAKLDPAMFSVEPPKGYKVLPFAPIDLSVSPATYVAGFLRLYADHMDGDFPGRLEDAIKALTPKLANPQSDGQLSEDQQKSIFYLASVAGITMKLKAGERWQYYPGVKLGEKDRMVFWYLDAKTNIYSAVYGDLRVEKVNKDQLPPASAASQ